MESSSIDQTSQATIELLGARLRRVEHLLYGASKTEAPPSPAVVSLADLERQFTLLVSNVRVYAELLRIYHTSPSLFTAPPPGVPPTQLDPDALRATVLSYASAFPATASALSAAVVDTPVPDAALSAQLVALAPRMAAMVRTQNALDNQVAQLRHRSEQVVRRYYETQALAAAACVADVEARIERAEGQVRRRETARRAEDSGM
ncbi:nuclear distribution protein [Niveomyces insectorum RCEF 264]|uniref:Nuclear distribution protein n=1 Tax=Niveomyces insectorum RCEF 264 TaxID=1081102 RepID=A0A162JYL0_9HYPO|nr:nuclear distribution protein [Niveomyces insectorum RCEF 264]